MTLVTLTVNDQEIRVKKGTSLLHAVEEMGIQLPTMCHNAYLPPQLGGACRMCVVELKGHRNLVTACSTEAVEGMVIYTHSQRVIDARVNVLELMISDHPLDCMTCSKAGDCKLQDYCYEYDVKESPYAGGAVTELPIDTSNNFFDYDPSKCIMCGQCVRICSELQCSHAIGKDNRGFESHVVTPFNKGLASSECVSCGNCVSYCPTGALMPKKKNKFRYWEVERVKTTCAYCGVGCQMNLLVKDNRVVDVEPLDGLANRGLLCVKGKFAYKFIDHPDRLKTPLIKKNGVLTQATWDEALTLITSKALELKSTYGGSVFSGLSSARCSNEENYLFQKMMRVSFASNNVDHCARLCHASTVAGLASTLGSGAMTNSNAEVLESDVILVTGSNTTETHPVIGSFMKQAQANGTKLIVIDPRRIDLAEYADVFLQITPGTNVAIFNGIMNVIIEEGLQDMAYIKERTENYETLVDVIRQCKPEMVAEICGVDVEDIRKAARIYAAGDAAGIYYAMGVTQHSTGTQGVKELACLAMLCGNIGKPSTGVNPLRGQNNVQGACDLGALPNVLTGYQKVTDKAVIQKFSKAWDTDLPSDIGLTVTEMINGGKTGATKFLYIMGENPMISEPDLNHVVEAFEATEFIVVQDIFLTDTAKMADVVLPAACFAEKDGTFTNTERRIQRVRKAVEAPGQALPDWEILMQLMNRMGQSKVYQHPSEIMEEIATLTPMYGGISYDRITEEGLQWPCPDKDHNGTKYLHKGSFKRGKGLFDPAPYQHAAEMTDEEYPIILTTGRNLYHWHTRTMTKRVEGIHSLYPSSYIEINPLTASELEVKDGAQVKVTSRRGEILTTVKVNDNAQEGVVFMPFHFDDGAANVLTNIALDPVAKIPELKVAAVKIEACPHGRKEDFDWRDRHG